MALSFEAAEELIYEFCKTYPQARTITYNLAEHQEEIYGPENTVALRGRISGSYRAASCGADFALANSDSNEKFERTLRHEILGHFGINTFKPDEKRAVLNAIIEARSEVGLETLWGYVDRLYPGQSDMRNAEEVYALACEAIEPSDRSAAIDGQKSYDGVCVSRTRAMRISDLINLTTMVAEGLHDSTRSQQTFPESDSAQFKQDTPMKTSEYPVWLAVQPDDREKMRAAAGQLSDGRSAVAWDKEEKLWYARPGCDLDRINEWLPDRSMRAGGGDPEAEFFDTLTQAGLVIKGMPVMNGKRQRVATTDDKGGKTSGVYCGYLDRRPAGWFINYHRAESSKDVTNWTATGGEANPLARLHIRAAAKQSQEDATRERAELHAERTLAAKTLYDQLPAADPSHPYLVRKGIPPTPELRQTRNGALVVPFFSAQGNFKTLQYIPETGDKLLFKDAPKKGNFLVVGGALEPGQPILYAEGYATARSLNLATERPVVMTIDAGNMVTVAQILHQRFPDSPHVFLADFDHAKDENKGLIMATEAASKVGGQVLYPAFNEREIAQGFTDFNDLHQSRGLDAVRDQTAPFFMRHDEVITVPDQPNAEIPGVFLTPKIRQTLEKEWTALQGDFFRQQIQLADQLKTDLRAALKAEKSDLKSLDTQSLSFGERIAASVGLMEPGSNGLQIAHLGHALKQLDKAEHEGWTTRSFDGQRMKLQEAGQYAIDMGRPNPAATGDLAKDRDTWVSEQAALRLSGAGLGPLVALDTSAQAAQFAEQMQARISEIVSEAKQDPFRTVELANLTLHQSVQGHADVQAQRFSLEELQGSVPIFTSPDAYADAAPLSRFTPEELQGSVAIFTRADAYADAIALSPEGSFVPATVATEDVVKWADLDVKDLAVIQAEPLREMATETMLDNTQSVPVYAEQIEAAGVDLNAQAPAAELLAPSVSPVTASAPAEPEAPAVLAEPALSASNHQVAPVAETVAPLVEAGPATVAEAQPAAVEPTSGSNIEIQPTSANVDMAPGASEPTMVNASLDNTVQAPTTTAEAPLADLTAASAASNDPATPATPATPELVQAAPETTQPSPVLQAVAAAPPVHVDEPIEPALIAPIAVASAVSASTARPDAAVKVPEDLAALIPRRAAPNEAPAAEAVMNSIDVGPRIGQDEPPQQPSQIDKDSLLTRVTAEPQSDNSVLYKLDSVPAFVDRGSRLEMVPGAGQSDERILAALLTAARFYRGQIELTGSDAFKAKAIELIAQNQVNVSMKNPAQQLMLDQSRQALNLPVVKPDAIHGDTPAPFDPAPPVAPAMNVAAAASGTAPLSPAVPEQQAAPILVNTAANNAYAPLDVPVPVSLVNNAAQVGPVDDAPPLGSAPQAQEIKPGVQDGSRASGTGVDPAIHQLSTSAVEGVTGKVMSCGKAPFRFDPANSESVHITLRTKTGIQTFWGKELAGLLRETRIEPGRMATLQYLGEKPVTVKTPVKDPDTGLVLHYEDKQAKRNQWSLGLLNGTAVRTGDDQGVKLAAYDAARFTMIQNSIMSQLNVPIEAPPRPADGLFWMTPNGQGSAKAGDGLSASRPPVDDVNVGKLVMSSWSQDGQLDMALFRGDGPYLQGVVRQGDQYQHVLVSLPGHAEAPPMVINQITEQGLVPIGVGNGINRSGGEPVAREHIAFKLDGDQAVRIGKLDFPAEVPPALHVRLGFDERWKDTNTLPKSSPAAAPTTQPSAMRPA